ncbi:unnamed protein product [Pararhodospirillum photometricum DSM 122]|uniref:Uncharacterized protein n=1 Tax=Pararhodospirillum photometricum DSM 122 TaxID=1150469 RepID=H6SKA8_PARPM|nr:unnamed protein product [Pararhodospirillum photometricum DSM 122]
MVERSLQVFSRRCADAGGFVNIILELKTGSLNKRDCLLLRFFCLFLRFFGLVFGLVCSRFCCLGHGLVGLFDGVEGGRVGTGRPRCVVLLDG